MKSIFDHFETSIGLHLSHEALYERAKLLALTDDYDRAMEDLKKATTMAPCDYKIRFDSRLNKKRLATPVFSIHFRKMVVKKLPTIYTEIPIELIMPSQLNS